MIRVTIGDVLANEHWDSPVQYYWCIAAEVSSMRGDSILTMTAVNTINGDDVEPVDLNIATTKPIYIERREEE